VLTTPHRKNLPRNEIFHKTPDVEEVHRLGISEDMMLRRMFGPMKDGITGSGEDYIKKSSVICATHKKIIERSNQDE
jgi:hypothetical protein